MININPQTFYVATDSNGIVLMKSYCEQEVVQWCKENGLEYRTHNK